VDWTDLGQNRNNWRAVLNMAVKGRVQKIYGELLRLPTNHAFCRMTLLHAVS